MTERVHVRFLSKLLGGVAANGSNFLLQILAMRALGPALFGQHIFALTHFQTALGLLEFNATSYVVPRLSQSRERYKSAVTLIAGLTAGSLLICLAYVAGGRFLGFAPKLWPEVGGGIVVAALFLAFAQSVEQKAVLVSDAGGTAKRVEAMRTLRSIVTLGVVGALVAFEELTLPRLQVLLIAFTALSAIGVARLGHASMGGGGIRPSGAELKEEARSFRAYAGPLIVFSLVGTGLVAVQRWMLQYVGGSVSQAYFGLASQFATACFLVTQAMTYIHQRETALAFGQGNMERVRILFQQSTKAFFLASAIPAVFLAVNAERVTVLFAGEQFRAAWPTVVIMALYPIHQTFGQMSSNLMFATNRTKAYVKIGLATSPLSLVLMILLLGRRTWFLPGLELGAIGLALVWFIAQLVATEWINLANCRYLKTSYPKLLASNLRTLAVLCGVAFFAGRLAEAILGSGAPAMGAAAFVHVAVATGLCVNSGLLGLDKDLRKELRRQLSRIVRWGKD